MSDYLSLTRDRKDIIVVIILLSHRIYMNDNWRPGGNGTLDLDLVRHTSEARIALVPPVSIEDRLLLWMVLIILSTYLLMGAGRLIALLSWVLALSRLTDWRRGWWRSKHHTESGLRCGGLESKFGRGLGPLDRRVVGWFCLCLGYKQGVCFGVPS